MKKSNKDELKDLLDEASRKTERFFGYPCNTAHDYSPLFPFFKYSLNNVGDPFVDSGYKISTHEIEREVFHFFADLYKLPSKKGWGYVTNGGTEGNMYGIFLGRQICPKAVLYFSEDTHYSIVKIARILNLPYKIIRSQQNGEIDYIDLEENIKKNKKLPAIVCANYGTTMKGAIDSVEEITKILKHNTSEYYIHVDAALFGMILPFIKGAPVLNFTEHIDSVAISGHKFIGAPFPCGIVLTKKKYVKQIECPIEYVGTLDTTISGSRNGHSPLLLWYAIHNRNFTREAKTCLENARYLFEGLKKYDQSPHLNPYSNIVWFNKPSKPIIDKWQLATQRDFAHIVVMQHVTKNKIEEFLSDIENSR